MLVNNLYLRNTYVTHVQETVTFVTHQLLHIITYFTAPYVLYILHHDTQYLILLKSACVDNDLLCVTLMSSQSDIFNLK